MEEFYFIRAEMSLWQQFEQHHPLALKSQFIPASRYLVRPPFVWITALQRCLIEPTYVGVVFCAIWCHSFKTTFSRFRRFSCSGRCQTCLLSRSKTCSIGFKLGLHRLHNGSSRALCTMIDDLFKVVECRKSLTCYESSVSQIKLCLLIFRAELYQDRSSSCPILQRYMP